MAKNFKIWEFLAVSRRPLGIFEIRFQIRIPREKLVPTWPKAINNRFAIRRILLELFVLLDSRPMPPSIDFRRVSSTNETRRVRL